MATFVEHIPTFFETGHAPRRWDVTTLEELLQLDVMKWHSSRDGFSHFATEGRSVLAIRNDGFEWWVIGSLSDLEPFDLPKWDGGKVRAKLLDGTECVLGRDRIRSICGHVITLLDGSKAVHVEARKRGYLQATRWRMDTADEQWVTEYQDPWTDEWSTTKPDREYALTGIATHPKD